MRKETVDLRFKCPFGCLVSGPSMSGKSHFILNIIKRADEFFDRKPDRIVDAYGSWQPAFEQVKNVEFVSGMDGLMSVSFNPKFNNLLILDDLMEELSNDKKASTLFTRDMHHKNVTVFFIVQNLFKQGRSMRDVSLNCQVLVLFNSPRDVEQIKVLQRQTGIKSLEEAYTAAIKDRYGFLVVNLQAHISSNLRLQFGILDKHRRVYWKK